MELLQDPSDEAENRWIIGTKVVIFICGTMLLLLFTINTYKYLIKQQKYKVLTISLFYLVSLMSIVLVMYVAFITPYKDYCALNWLLASYGVAYAYLILGICQGGTLTVLSIQLQCLFNYSKQLAMTELHAQEEAERIMILDLRKKQRRVKYIVILGTFAVCILYVANMVIWHRKIINNDPRLCNGMDFMNSSVYENLYKFYFAERITASLLIDFWLIWQTCKVMSLLKSQTETGSKRSFLQEKRRINFIYWSFVVSYISYSIADMGQIIFNEGNGFNIYPETG